MMKTSLRYVVLLFSICLLTACADRSRLQTRLVANADTKVCSVALVPFENWTRRGELAQLGGRIFASELVQNGQYSLVQEGEIGIFFLRQRLMPGTLLYKEHYDSLASQYQADAVILGRIVESGKERRRGGASVPYLSLHVDMYDARSGRLLLNSVHQRWGDDYRKVMHFGVITTQSGLMKKMAQEIINDWVAKGVVCR